MSNLGFTPGIGGQGAGKQSLKSKILQPSLSSVYAVLIGLPNATDFNFPGNHRERLELTCVEASLPGSSLATIETNRDYRGVVEKHAYTKLYDDTIDLTFMVSYDANYMQIRLFDYWMRFIVGEDKGDDVLESRSFEQNLRYPSDYQTDTLKIVKFEKDLNFGDSKTKNILVYNFMQAFPKAINSIPVSYEGNSVLKCTVSMTYSRYFISELSQQTDTVFNNRNNSNPTPGAPENRGKIPGSVYDIAGGSPAFSYAGLTQTNSLLNLEGTQIFSGLNQQFGFKSV